MNRFEAPRGGLPPLGELFEPSSLAPAGLGVLGDLLWVAVYVLVIRQGFRERTYGIPLFAICLNFTWELVFTTVHPPPSRVTLGLHLVWLAIDALILLQVLRYGRERQVLPEVRRYFPWVVGGTLLLCFVGHLTLYDYQLSLALFPDTEGITTAFVINLIMSVLFVAMLLHRRDSSGLSMPVAWLKMLGTGVISLANVLVFLLGTGRDFELRFRQVGAQEWIDAGTRGGTTFHAGFAFYLFAVIFLFDVLYIVLLRRRRLRSSVPAATPEAATRPASV